MRVCRLPTWALEDEIFGASAGVFDTGDEFPPLRSELVEFLERVARLFLGCFSRWAKRVIFVLRWSVRGHIDHHQEERVLCLHIFIGNIARFGRFSR